MFSALRTMAALSGMAVVETSAYRGTSQWLMLWGPGAPDRVGPMRRHLESGGHVIAWDGAYWQRNKKLRVSIDAAHPQSWVMRRDWPADRFEADGVRVTNAWDPRGPVVIAGLGRKALTQYGESAVLAWEGAMARECRARGWDVRYRRKRIGMPTLPGIPLASDQPIEQALDGASLVITWHSNVAVDAIRMGLPVVCRDGAAAAVCPSEIPSEIEPLAESMRDRFLANLAWFQWAPSEAAQCWAFLAELLS